MILPEGPRGSLIQAAETPARRKEVGRAESRIEGVFVVSIAKYFHYEIRALFADDIAADGSSDGIDDAIVALVHQKAQMAEVQTQDRHPARARDMRGPQHGPVPSQGYDQTEIPDFHIEIIVRTDDRRIDSLRRQEGGEHMGCIDRFGIRAVLYDENVHPRPFPKHMAQSRWSWREYPSRLQPCIV